jgi:Subtilase family/Putative Ig domain
MPRFTPRRGRAITVIGSAALVGAAIALPATAAPDVPHSNPIHLVSGDFTPTAITTQNQAQGLSDATRGTWLVQFDGPVQEAWAQTLRDAGIEVVEYVPDFAFKVRMTPAQARAVQQRTEVNWVGRFQPSWKLSKPARDRSAAGKPSVYRVRPASGASLNAMRDAAAATGAVASVSDGTLLVAAEPGQLTRIAGLEDVASIDAFTINEKHNESAAGVILKANAANARGYDGSTQIVAVADTGLGNGTAATAHPDVPSSRIVAIHDWPGADQAGCVDVQPDGPQDVDSGHGTHTTLSVLGDGDANGVGRAAAYAARLVFQATEDYAHILTACAGQATDGYLLVGLPGDLATLFQQAYTDGARVHSNSWGSDAAGAYSDEARMADAFINTHRDMTITFSAGNEGVDANSDGVIDNDSMGSPATAKNVIAVGASENARPSWTCDTTLNYQAQSTKEQATYGNRTCQQLGGVMPLPTYGAWWPDNYAANPIKDDPQAGNPNQMAAFSSRGPADDGRVKPDVVAPGSWVLSGYSDRYQQGYDAGTNPKNSAYQYDGYGFPYSSAYKYMSGTSMSNPIAAGGAAVVRDYYNKARGVNASAALVKATMINSAVDLLDENNDGVNDNDFPIPNAHEGWGLINLDAATDGTARFTDEAATGLSTGGLGTFTYDVQAGTPFKASLVWTDKEAATTASVSLVNDLDLEVTAPNGTVYKGNVFSGGWSATGGSADRRNNVENVYLASPVAGTYTVRVRGFNVPMGPQKFALVVDAGFGTGGGTNHDPTITNPGAQTSAAGTPVNKQISASDADGDALSYTATGLPAGLSIGSSNGLVSGTPAGPAGTSNVTVTVSDGRGGSASTTFTWTITTVTPPQQLLANPDFEAGTTGWSGTTTVITTSTTRPAHSPTHWAWFGGYGRSASENLSQQVSIPASAASATLSFWVRIDTAETTSSVAYDTLKVQVLNSSGAVIGTLATLSNLDKSTGYVQKSYNVSAYKGQTIRLRWLMTEDSSLQTTFATDDGALAVG